MLLEKTGSNPSDIRQNNRALILKLIALKQHVSRVELARMTGLTKTTLGKIVADLLEHRLVDERSFQYGGLGASPGRRPIELQIGSRSPCICGILIRRDRFFAVIADLAGQILIRDETKITKPMTASDLILQLLNLYHTLTGQIDRQIIAIGVASMGPVDVVSQKIVNPPNFYGIHDVAVSSILHEKTGLPTFLIHDADAGALAESIYGNSVELSNFIYLHIMNGIGAGYILQGQLYRGDLGQCGEIGHTSIHYAGPVCECGNNGCLELYANVASMNQKIAQLKEIVNQSDQSDCEFEPYSWEDIVRAASDGDVYAVAALDEFCTYVAYALANMVNLLDMNHIIIGYSSGDAQIKADTVIEKMLEEKLNRRVLVARNRRVFVRRSVFGGDAPLIGSIAQITDLIFQGKFNP